MNKIKADQTPASLICSISPRSYYKSFRAYLICLFEKIIGVLQKKFPIFRKKIKKILQAAQKVKFRRKLFLFITDNLNEIFVINVFKN